MSSKLPRFPANLLLAAVTAIAFFGALSPANRATAEESASLGHQDAAEITASDGDRLVADAALHIKDHASVRALIHAEVSIWDHAFTGKGLYLATRNEGNFLSRLELKLDSQQSANSDLRPVTSKLLDVNDGRYLWRDREWNGSRKVDRVDLARVRPAPGKAGVPDSSAEQMPSLNGGLEPLLASLRDNFQFGKIVASRIDRVPVLRTIGVWRPERLALLVSSGKKKGDDTAQKAPGHLPREVAITFGRDDLFPYEVDFRPGDSSGAGEGASMRYRFYEVVLGAAIDPRFYVYKPGDVIVEDRTEKYLEQGK